jgi:hypothetical protein
MIALLGALIAVAIVWWIVRRLLVLALLVAAVAIAGVWLTQHPGTDHHAAQAQLRRVQHSLSHNLTHLLHHHGVVHHH